MEPRKESAALKITLIGKRLSQEINGDRAGFWLMISVNATTRRLTDFALVTRRLLKLVRVSVGSS